MLTLSWQPPYDWSWMLGFLAARAVEGVETVGELYYTRSLVIGEYRGLVSVVPDLKTHQLQVRLSPLRQNAWSKLSGCSIFAAAHSILLTRWAAWAQRVLACGCLALSMPLNKV